MNDDEWSWNGSAEQHHLGHVGQVRVAHVNHRRPGAVLDRAAVHLDGRGGEEGDGDGPAEEGEEEAGEAGGSSLVAVAGARHLDFERQATVDPFHILRRKSGRVGHFLAQQVEHFDPLAPSVQKIQIRKLDFMYLVPRVQKKSAN